MTAPNPLVFEFKAEGLDKLRADLVALGTSGRRSFSDVAAGANTSAAALRGGGDAVDRFRDRLGQMERERARASSGLGQFRGQIGNLSYQLNDAVVQLQGGASPFVVIAQQVSQAAGAFGPLGAVIGATIATASAGAGMLYNVATAATEAASASELMGRALGEAGGDVEALTAKFERLTASQRDLEGINLVAGVRAARKELEAEIDALTKAVKASVPSDFFGGMGVAEKLKPVISILTEMKNGALPVADGLARVEAALRKTGLSAGFTDQALLAAASSAGEAGKSLERAEAVMALFNGTATAGQRALLGFGQAAKSAATMALEASAAIKNDYVSALTKAMPLQAAMNERDAQRVAVNTALEAGIVKLADAQTAYTAIDKDYADTVDSINARLSVREKAVAKDAKAHEAGVDAVEDYIGKLRGEGEGLRLSDRERAVYAAGLEVERIAKGRLSDIEMPRYIARAKEEAATLYDVRTAHTKAEEARRDAARGAEKAVDSVTAGADEIGDDIAALPEVQALFLEVFK